MRVHACWLDRGCRQVGVGAFTYFNFKRFTIRINPICDRSVLARAFNDGKPTWSWRVIQIFRKDQKVS